MCSSSASGFWSTAANAEGTLKTSMPETHVGWEEDGARENERGLVVLWLPEGGSTPPTHMHTPHTHTYYTCIHTTQTYTCRHTPTHAYPYTHHTHIHIHTPHTHTYIYTCMHTHAHHIHIYIHIQLCTYIHIYHTCKHACTHHTTPPTHTHMYTHHIHKNTHIHRVALFSRGSSTLDHDTHFKPRLDFLGFKRHIQYLGVMLQYEKNAQLCHLIKSGKNNTQYWV